MSTLLDSAQTNFYNKVENMALGGNERDVCFAGCIVLFEQTLVWGDFHRVWIRAHVLILLKKPPPPTSPSALDELWEDHWKGVLLFLFYIKNLGSSGYYAVRDRAKDSKSSIVRWMGAYVEFNPPYLTLWCRQPNHQVNLYAILNSQHRRQSFPSLFSNQR